MSPVLFWLLMFAAPLPALWLWFKFREWRDAEMVRRHAAEREARRARFGGAVRIPGTTRSERRER